MLLTFLPDQTAPGAAPGACSYVASAQPATVQHVPAHARAAVAGQTSRETAACCQAPPGGPTGPTRPFRGAGALVVGKAAPSARDFGPQRARLHARVVARVMCGPVDFRLFELNGRPAHPAFSLYTSRDAKSSLARSNSLWKAQGTLEVTSGARARARTCPALCGPAHPLAGMRPRRACAPCPTALVSSGRTNACAAQA